jgi:hypothetical protein
MRNFWASNFASSSERQNWDEKPGLTEISGQVSLRELSMPEDHVRRRTNHGEKLSSAGAESFRPGPILTEDSPDLAAALGAETIETLTNQTGMTHDDFLACSANTCAATVIFRLATGPYRLFGLPGFLRTVLFAQSHARAAAILVDEFDASFFKGVSNFFCCIGATRNRPIN